VTIVIVATVAILPIAVGCGLLNPSAEEVVAAGDIANCGTEGDEATAELLEGIDGTVLTLGDNAYPRGTAEDFEECYEPSWGRFKGAPSPFPATTSTTLKGPETTSSTSGRPQVSPRGLLLL
jgi:hypothetical protein